MGDASVLSDSSPQAIAARLLKLTQAQNDAGRVADLNEQLKSYTPDGSVPTSPSARLGALQGLDTTIGAQRAIMGPDPLGRDALDRQRDEIVNERQASNEADSQFGDQMATRALRRAVASKLALSDAADQANLTQAHEQVVRNAGDETMRLTQPKYDAQHDHDLIVAQTAQEKNAMDAALKAGTISASEYNAWAGAKSKVLATPFAANAGQLGDAPTPVPVPSPTTNLRTAVTTRTGGAAGQYNPTQEALIARLLNSPAGKGKTRADAIAVLDRVKPAGWQ
jgi:hypothetical protein